MEWDQIKKIVTDNQHGNDWNTAYILKFKTGNVAVYYGSKAENFMQTEAYIVLDILEWGSAPIEEIAVYRRKDDEDGLDDLSYYSKRAFPAINRENLDSEVLGTTMGRNVIRQKLREKVSSNILKKYC